MFNKVLKTVQRKGYRKILTYSSSKDYPILQTYANTLEASEDLKPADGNRGAYWADAAGVILGTACTWWMGVIWGAAFSHCYDACSDFDKPVQVNTPYVVNSGIYVDVAPFNYVLPFYQ